jgi:hypothetical protein
MGKLSVTALQAGRHNFHRMGNYMNDNAKWLSIDVCQGNRVSAREAGKLDGVVAELGVSDLFV